MRGLPFPAGAGMNRGMYLSALTVATVPRRRGDEPGEVVWSQDDVARSPQARG